MYTLYTAIESKHHACRVPGSNLKKLTNVHDGTVILNKLNARVYEFKDKLKDLTLTRTYDKDLPLCPESQRFAYNVATSSQVSCTTTKEQKKKSRQDSGFQWKHALVLLYTAASIASALLVTLTMAFKYMKPGKQRERLDRMFSAKTQAFWLSRSIFNARGLILFIFSLLYLLLLPVFYGRLSTLNKTFDCATIDNDESFDEDNVLFVLAVIASVCLGIHVCVWLLTWYQYTQYSPEKKTVTK